MGRTTIVTGLEVDRQAILDFAQRTYGAHAHQARANHLEWSYVQNPHAPDGLGHMLVARTEEGRVAGFVNRFLVDWQVHDRTVAIPAITDLAVDEQDRQGGLGLRLVMSAVKGVEHAFVNGSNAHSSPLFRGLKYQEVPGGWWMRRVLAPLRGGTRLLLHKTLGQVPVTSGFLTTAELASGVRLHDRPDDALLAQVVTLFHTDPAPIKLHWTIEGLRWRFFHPLGPRHLMLSTTTSSGALSSVMLMAAGMQRGIQVCRPVAFRCPDPAHFELLLGTAMRHAKRHGVDACIAFTFDPNEARAMQRLGLARQPVTPATFFHHARRGMPFDPQELRIQGAASDIGFTAIP